MLRRYGQNNKLSRSAFPRSAPIGYYIEPGFREGGYGGYIKNHFPLGGDKIAYYIRLEDPLQ